VDCFGVAELTLWLFVAGGALLLLGAYTLALQPMRRLLNDGALPVALGLVLLPFTSKMRRSKRG
jgi:hypothetical protein